MSADRPQWVRAIRHFVGDEVIDEKYGFPMDGEDDDLHERVEQAVNAVVCAHYGHQIEDDQCMKPEHRYCVWCGRRESVICPSVTDRAVRAGA